MSKTTPTKISTIYNIVYNHTWSNLKIQTNLTNVNKNNQKPRTQTHNPNMPMTNLSCFNPKIYYIIFWKKLTHILLRFFFSYHVGRILKEKATKFFTIMPIYKTPSIFLDRKGISNYFFNNKTLFQQKPFLRKPKLKLIRNLRQISFLTSYSCDTKKNWSNDIIFWLRAILAP